MNLYAIQQMYHTLLGGEQEQFTKTSTPQCRMARPQFQCINPTIGIQTILAAEPLLMLPVMHNNSSALKIMFAQDFSAGGKKIKYLKSALFIGFFYAIVFEPLGKHDPLQSFGRHLFIRCFFNSV